MKQRQKHIVYVMRIMETYVRSMLSFFTKKDRDNEDETDEARSKDAIERILVKLQEADTWIPPSLTQAQKEDMKENMDRIIHLCETIKGAVIDLSNRTEEVDVFGRTDSSHKARNISTGTPYTGVLNAVDLQRGVQKTKEE
jgi:hypothetical protein